MAGTVHNIITRRLFDFSNVAANNWLEVPLIRALDVSDAKSIEVVVRVHTSSGLTSTRTISIHTRAISLTSEEPDANFTNSTELGTVTLNDTTPTAPSLALGSLTPPWGHMIRMAVRGTQPGSTAALTATLSIDLVVRDN